MKKLEMYMISVVMHYGVTFGLYFYLSQELPLLFGEQATFLALLIVFIFPIVAPAIVLNNEPTKMLVFREKRGTVDEEQEEYDEEEDEEIDAYWVTTLEYDPPLFGRTIFGKYMYLRPLAEALNFAASLLVVSFVFFVFIAPFYIDQCESNIFECVERETNGKRYEMFFSISAYLFLMFVCENFFRQAFYMSNEPEYTPSKLAGFTEHSMSVIGVLGAILFTLLLLNVYIF